MLFLYSLETRLVFRLLLILHSFRLYLLLELVDSTCVGYSQNSMSRVLKLAFAPLMISSWNGFLSWAENLHELGKALAA